MPEPSNSNLQLENILQTMGDAFVSLDTDWKYTFVNDHALRLMGKTKGDLIGKTLWEAFPDTVGSTFEHHYRKVMSDRVPAIFVTHYESYNMWLEVRAYSVNNGIAIFYTDITAQKQAEFEIRSFNEKLEATVQERTRELELALKELEDFSYTVSHDLRAPIRALHSYLSIFLEEHAGKLDNAAKTIIINAQNNSRKMGELIDGLLDFTGLGKAQLRKNQISMKQVVEQEWNVLKSKEPPGFIDFTLDELPPVPAHESTIRQVWSSLISNALKFTRHVDKPRVRVSYTLTQDSITYSISDNGIGFDMKYVHKLFGIFQRLHNNDGFQGNGMSLAIVHRIISKHNGNIWAESKLNEGTTFYFSLPREAGEK